MRREAVRSDVIRLLLATLFFGAAAGIFQSSINNFLESTHGLVAEERGWLEFPRELPGFLLIFVTGLLLIRLRESQIAAVAMTLAAVGAVGLAYLAPGMWMLVAWIAIWSLGDHILFAVHGPLRPGRGAPSRPARRGLQPRHDSRRERRLPAGEVQG